MMRSKGQRLGWAIGALRPWTSGVVLDYLALSDSLSRFTSVPIRHGAELHRLMPTLFPGAT
jgi:hypothetical protein